MSIKFYNAKHPDYKSLYFTELGMNSGHRCKYIYCGSSSVWGCNYCEYTTHNPSTHCGRHYQYYHEIKSTHLVNVAGNDGSFRAILTYDKRAKRVNNINRITPR